MSFMFRVSVHNLLSCLYLLVLGLTPPVTDRLEEVEPLKTSPFFTFLLIFSRNFWFDSLKLYEIF